jgi:uncharacterized protein YndB with AHSA1/START domain
MADEVTLPDISKRPHRLQVERVMRASADALYKAWTQQFELWFAKPGTVLMEPRVNAPFFFETEFKVETAEKAERHPHYGRFLQLEPGRLVKMSWVIGAGGTEGAETIVTVELTPEAGGTRLRLTHSGFASQAAMKQHEEAWPLVLKQQDEKLAKHGG